MEKFSPTTWSATSDDNVEMFLFQSGSQSDKSKSSSLMHEKRVYSVKFSDEGRVFKNTDEEHKNQCEYT